MIEAVRLTRKHIPDIYRVVLRNEPFAREVVPTLMHFRAAANQFEGFALYDGNRAIGWATFSNLTPLVDAIFSATVDREYRGRWVNRRAFRQIFTFPFVDLGLPRISSYTISGVTSYLDSGLTKTGFRVEGTRRRAVLLPDGYHDVTLYGMLKEECRWL